MGNVAGLGGGGGGGEVGGVVFCMKLTKIGLSPILPFIHDALSMYYYLKGNCLASGAS